MSLIIESKAKTNCKIKFSQHIAADSAKFPEHLHSSSVSIKTLPKTGFIIDFRSHFPSVTTAEASFVTQISIPHQEVIDCQAERVVLAVQAAATHSTSVSTGMNCPLFVTQNGLHHERAPTIMMCHLSEDQSI